MGLGLLPVFLLRLAAPSPETVEEAFARGDYARVVELGAATPETTSGATLYLVGLARFRQGHPAEALAALEEAANRPDPPPRGAWEFNRAACLYELRRFGQAEQGYRRAAELDPSLRGVALVNAGFAALDAGEPGRASELAREARAGGDPRVAELAVDLEERARAAGVPAGPGSEAVAAYRAGLAAYDAGRWSEARQEFLRATALDPLDGKSRIMAGAAALKLEEPAVARADFVQALGMQLAPADVEVARAYLAESAYGLASRPSGWRGSVRGGAGYDSNALQSGAAVGERAPVQSAAVGSAALVASAEVVYRPRPGAHLAGEVGYAFDQLAYLASAAEDYSLQLHTLTGALEWTVDRVRLGAMAGGQLVFTGVTSFRGLEASGLAGVWAAWDEATWSTTRGDVQASLKAPLGAEFDYLGGSRVDLRLLQEFRWSKVTLGLTYQFRHEGIGTLTQLGTVPVGGGMGPPAQVSVEYVIPYGYDAHAFGLGATFGVGARVRLGLGAGAELRWYSGSSYVDVTPEGSPTVTNVKQRHDQRYLGNVALGVTVWKGLSLALRWDVVVSRSNIERTSGRVDPSCLQAGATCSALDYDDKSYTRHLVTLETIFVF